MTRRRAGTETPLWPRPRSLAEGLTPDGQRKGPSGGDPGYQPKNRRVAWEPVKATRGSGGIDGQRLEAFEQGLDEPLARLHEALRTDGYPPRPVRRVEIPPAGRPGETRPRGHPAVYDRVCQPAWRRRVEPICCAGLGRQPRWLPVWALGHGGAAHGLARHRGGCRVDRGGGPDG